VCRTEGYDRRTLALRYFYAIEEVSELFTHDKESGLYSLRTCKGCRAKFLSLLGQWVRSGGRLADDGLDDDGNQSVTLEEWKRLHGEEA
jgi:hypothetical protein